MYHTRYTTFTQWPCTVYDDLNSLIHKQIHVYLAADFSASYPLRRVNVDKLISKDPGLSLMPLSECKGYGAKTNYPTALAHHVKNYGVCLA